MKDDDKKTAIEVLDKMSARTVDVISALGNVFNGANNYQDYRVVNELGLDVIKQFNKILSKIIDINLELLSLQDCISKTKKFIEK